MFWAYVVFICVAISLLVTIYVLQTTNPGLPYQVVQQLVTENVNLLAPQSDLLVTGRNALISQDIGTENGIYHWDSSTRRLALQTPFTQPLQVRIADTDTYLMVVGPSQVYQSLATVPVAAVSSALDNPGYQVYNLTVSGTGTFQNGATVKTTVNGEDFASQDAIAQTKPDNLNTLTAQQVTQLSNMGNNTINNTQWGYVGGMSQNVGSEANVSFQEVQVNYGLSPSPVSITLYTSSGSAAFPVGTKGVVVELQAAGGAGGSEGITNDVGGGGGSGSYATFFLSSAQINGQTGLDFTVAGSSNQSDGGNTTVSWQGGALLATTFGGGRGVGGSNRADGGDAGDLAVLENGINGLVFTGSYGQAGFDYQSVLYLNVQSGKGADSVYGAGGGSGMWTGEGPLPMPGEFGAGGSGGVDDRNATGGNGGAGFVRVWIYE